MTLAFSLQTAEAAPLDIDQGASQDVSAASSAHTAPLSPALGGDRQLAGPQLAKTPDPLPAELQEKVRIVFAAGQYNNAAGVCAKLLNAHKTSPFLWVTLGQCHAKRDAFNEALTCLNRAQELDATCAIAFISMAEVYMRQGRTADAHESYRQALRADPTDVVVLNDFGTFLNTIGKPDEAALLFEEAINRAPNNAPLLYNSANAQRQLGQNAQAMALYRRALEIAPDLKEARHNYGQLLALEQQPGAAVEQFSHLVRISPSNDAARASKMHMQGMLGDFSWTDEYKTHRRQLGLTGTPVTPFATLALEDNPDLLRLRTQAYASSTFIDRRRDGPQRTPPKTRPARLKVGYFSADFHSHATMHLMTGLLRSHDKKRFEIHAFSYGPAQDDSQRAAAVAFVDHFHDVSGLSDQALVELAQRENLDIAVDLKGYTGFNRSAIFGNQLAPLHISYLGYPGTMGSQVFDYIISDSVISPAGTERHFDEHLIRMPHCYQPNDNMRRISPRQFTRADCGLPEEGFIFCCFNNSYKITPREFDVWMRLLSQTDNSVLWLLSAGPDTEANLRREAKSRGVDPDRLVFAERMSQDEHLARQKVADLFLDTFAVNAHTTGSDALWAGLPMLTLPGAQFAARVGASLLTAMDMPELIATSERHYEQIALQYYRDPEGLLSLRSKLKVNRLKAQLFDTKGFTLDLENAFDTAFDRWMRNLPPEHLTIKPHTQSKLPPNVKAAVTAA